MNSCTGCHISLWRSRWCGTVSKALLKSSNITSIWPCPWFMISVQSWSASISWVSQDIPLRKPCCLFVIILCLLRWSQIFDTISKCLFQVIQQFNQHKHVFEQLLFLACGNHSTERKWGNLRCSKRGTFRPIAIKDCKSN